MFSEKLSKTVMNETELIIFTIVSFLIIEARLGIKITIILITKVKIAEITVLSVKEEMNIPIAISAPPKNKIPSKE